MCKSFRWLCCFLLCIACMSACSVSFPCEKPTEGIWYCEDLEISIDFGAYSEGVPDCAARYSDNGSQEKILCYFDYGSGITLTTKDQQTHYLVGTFSYQKGNVVVTSYTDGTAYEFVRIDQ